MIPEHVKTRRGEPVFVVDDDGTERAGTIEFGDETTGLISVYCERGGRVIIRDNFSKRLRPDPGSLRPVWKSLGP